MAERLLLLYIVLLPWSSSSLPWHAQWADVVFAVLMPVFLYTRVGRLSFERLDGFVLVYVAAVSLSLVDAASLRLGVIEVVKTLSVAIMYAVATALARDRATRLRAWRVLVWTAIATAVVGLLYAGGYALLFPGDGPLGRTMQVPYLGHVRRLSAGFVTPEMFGDYLTVAMPFTLAWFALRDQGRMRIGAAAAIGAIAAAEFLTFSHSWPAF